MIETVKLSSKGQLVIPERMRNKLGLNQGNILVIKDIDNQLIIEREDSFLKKISEKEEKNSYNKIVEKDLKKVWDNELDEGWGNLL